MGCAWAVGLWACHDCLSKPFEAASQCLSSSAPALPWPAACVQWTATKWIHQRQYQENYIVMRSREMGLGVDPFKGGKMPRAMEEVEARARKLGGEAQEQPERKAGMGGMGGGMGRAGAVGTGS